MINLNWQNILGASNMLPGLRDRVPGPVGLTLQHLNFIKYAINLHHMYAPQFVFNAAANCHVFYFGAKKYNKYFNFKAL